MLYKRFEKISNKTFGSMIDFYIVKWENTPADDNRLKVYCKAKK